MLPRVMGLPARAGRDSDRRVQPRQTDAVDQFVAREANGYKAEGFSRQRVLCQGIIESPRHRVVPSISRHGQAESAARSAVDRVRLLTQKSLALDASTPRDRRHYGPPLESNISDSAANLFVKSRRLANGQVTRMMSNNTLFYFLF